VYTTLNASPEHASALSTRQETSAVRETTRSEVGLSPKASKDIAYVVRRFDASLKSTVPLAQDAHGDRYTCIVNVVDGDEETVLIENTEVLKDADPWWWSVEIRA
jgi:hypothetical protein